MSLVPGCPRCATPVAGPGQGRGWSCPEHGPIRPLWRPQEASYDAFAEHLQASTDFPTYLPWPVHSGWSVTDFAKGHAAVVIEDLNATGMLANRKLARAVSDASFGELRRQVEYKTAWYGASLTIADRWYPSSKTCSGCGQIKADLTLADRVYACTACGLVIDRDVNAAVNLARYSETSASPPLRAAA